MQIQFIKPAQIAQYLDEGAQFIDLRDEADYRTKHIKGAVSMPYEIFPEHFASLPRNRTYVLYCGRGATSMLAAEKMMEKGYHVYSLSGGMAAATVIQHPRLRQENSERRYPVRP